MKSKTLVLFIIILILTLFRIPFLLNQPPFLDEAIYVNFSKNIVENFNLLSFYLPLRDGISPIFIYANAVTYFFVKNPILSGRLTSLFFYSLSIYFFYIYTKKYLKSKNYLVAVLFLAFNPFIFLYAKMALLEMSVILFSILFLIQSEKTLLTPSLKNIIICALTFLLVIFSKYTGCFVIILFFLRTIQVKRADIFFKTIIAIILIFVFLLPLTNRLFITLSFHSESYGLFDLKRIINNLRLIFIWQKDYFGIIFLLIMGFLIVINRKKTNVIFATALIFFVVLFFGFFSTNFFPRYLILLPLLFSIIISSINKNKFYNFLLFIFAVIYLSADRTITFQLAKAKIAKEDVYQYATDWTSGKNIINNLQRLKNNENICISKDTFDYFLIVKESYFINKKNSLLVSETEKSCLHLKTVNPHDP